MKSYTLVYAPEAEDDLIRLYDYIASAADPMTAIGYVERLQAHCDGLANAPHRGHVREDIRPGLRIIGFERRVTIAFMFDDDRVTILRLYYGGQNWERTI